MTENSMKALAQVIGRVTVLSGIYIGKQGEDTAMATFRAKYTYLQQVSEEAAEEMYRSVIEEGISPDNILSISCMGYTHEQIQSMLRGNEAWHVVHLILHFRIYPRK